MSQHHLTGSETSPSYAPGSSRFGSEPPSVEDDVVVWRYSIVSCMPETMTTTCRDIVWLLFNRYGIVAFSFPLGTLQAISETILRVRWPNQQCHSTEGQWLINHVKCQIFRTRSCLFYHSCLYKLEYVNITRFVVSNLYKILLLYENVHMHIYRQWGAGPVQPHGPTGHPQKDFYLNKGLNI